MTDEEEQSRDGDATRRGYASARLDRGASQEPLWLQLKARLRHGIVSGEYPADSRLPSESRLCGLYGVSRTVVREALQDLVVDGFVLKVKGKGTYVTPRERATEVLTRPLSYSREMIQHGRHVTTSVRLQERAPATTREAGALGLDPGAEIVRIRRVISVDTQPRWVTTSALPIQLVPGLEHAELENRSLYDTLRLEYGLHIAAAERWIDAAHPSPEEADALRIAPDTPVLSIESISSLRDGTVVEHFVAVYLSRGARMRISTAPLE